MAILGTVKAVTGTAFIVDDSGVKRPVNVGDVVQVGDSIQTTGGAKVELEMLTGIPMQIGPNQLVAFTEDLGRVLASDPSEDAVNLATIQTVIKAIESGKDVNDAIEEAGAGSISNDPEGSSFVMLMRVGEVFDPLQFSFASGSASRSEIRNARGDDIVLAGLGSSAGTGSNGAGGGNGGGTGGGTGAGNLRPTGTPATITPTEDTPISVPLAGTDPDGTITAITVTQVPPATQGTLVYDNDGNPSTPPIAVPLNTPLTPLQASSVQFVPAPNYNGPVAPVQFTVTDNGGLTSPPATITIADVTPVNDGPTGTPATITPTEDTPISVPLAGTDPDGTITAITVTQVPPATQGTLVYDNDGNPSTPPIAVPLNTPLTPLQASSVQFLPAPNYNGPVAPVQFTVTDNGGLTSPPATITIADVTPVNDGPTGTPATITPTEDTPISVPLAGTDPDGTITAITVTQVPPATQGTLVYDNDGNPSTPPIAVPLNTPLTPLQASSVQFVPAPNYNGPVAPVQFTVTDNGGLTSPPATITIADVTPVNDGPTGTPATITPTEDTPISVPLAGTDPDGTITAITVTQVPPATQGTLVYDNDGNPSTPPIAVPLNTPLTPLQASSVQFLPAPNYNGPVAPVQFTVTDNGGLTSPPATITIADVTPVNDGPTGTPATITPTEDTPISVPLAGTDPDGTITAITVTQVPPATQGTLVYDNDGNPSTPPIAVPLNTPLTPLQASSVQFVPAPNYNGPVAPVQFTVTDNGGLTSPPATITIADVTPVNDGPTGTPATITPTEDTPISVPLAGTDPDGTITAITVTQVPPATQGTLVYDNDGNPSTPPIVVPLNTPLTPLQASSVQFVPAPNYNGPVAPVQFTVTDNGGLTSPPATITIADVTPVNDGPVANDDVASTSINTPITNIDVKANDVDPDNTKPELVVSNVIVSPAQGLVTINPDGTINFTPAFNFTGPASITYTITDPSGLSDTATLIVNVGNNNPPDSANFTKSTPEDTPLALGVADFVFTDPDAAQTLTAVRIDSLPTNGALTLNGSPVTAGQIIPIADIAAGNLVFTPDLNENGNNYATFTFSVQDNAGAFDLTPNTATLNVTPVNDAPVAASGSITPTEDTPISVPLSGTDIDGTIASFTITAGPTPAQGSLVYDNDGNPATPPIAVPLNTPLTPAQAATVQFVPAANYNGTVAPVTYTVTDNQGLASTPATVTINNVTPVNDAPVDGNEANTVAQNVTLNVPAGTGLLANTTDIDGATPTVTSFTVNSTTVPVTPTTPGSTLIPGVGTITINSDGSYSFAPAANYVGAIPVITYTVNDNAAVNPLTDTSTLTLTMGANNPPVDGNETNTVTEDTTLTVADGAAGDLLNNATDADSNPLSITSFTVNSTTVPVTPTTPGSTLIPGVGTITINSNGSYSFAPVANYTGAIPVITYTVSDGVGGTDTSTLTLSITAVNDAPVAASGSITPTEDTPISVPLSGTDIDGTIASFTITAGPTPAQGSLVYDNDGNPATPPIAVPLNTPLTPAQAATVQFVPAANYNGTVAPVTYTVTDNQGLASTPATVTINNVTPVNDAPVDGNEANTVAQNVTLNVPAGTGLLANTTDIDGATPTVTSFTVNSTTVPVTPTTPGSTLIPGVGTITINSDGSYSFAPAANYVGAIPVITYTVNDNAAVNPLTDTSTLTLTMGANNPPVDGNETNTVTEDTTLTVADGAAGDLLNNATDADSNPLSITSFTVNSTTVPVTPTTPGSTLIPGVGTITINSNGSYSFAPVANYTGAIPVITYTVSDGVGGTDTSTLTLSITAVNDAPVAASGSITPTEDTPISVPLSGTDIDGTIASFTITAGPTPAQGSLVYDNDGNPATPPIAVPLNTPLTPAQAATVQFVPAANYNGTVAPVTYTVTDNQGLASTPATVTINNVTPVNDAPVDGNEANTVAQNVTLNVPAGTGLLANTTDIDGATPTVTSFTVNSTTVPVTPTTPGSTLIPGVGTITINSDGSYSFAPAANYVGAIPVITYTVNDNAAVNPLTDTSTLTLTMGANNPPVDGNETNTVTEDTTLTVADGAAGDLLNNATDADSNPLSITSFTVNSTTVPVTPTTPGSTLIPGVGTITINSNGSYSFAPVANYTGAIPVITYTVSDGVGGTDTSTLTLSITAVNDAPVAASGSITPTEDTPISVPLSGTDIDGTIASFTITAGPTPAQGSLVYDNDGNPATPPIAVPLNTPLTPAQAATVQFVPAANYNGTVAPVTYTVTDNQGLASTPATVTINNVTPVNDAPVDGNEANTVAQNVTLNVPAGTGLLANTTDIDGATPTVTSFTVNSTTVPVTPTTPGSTLIPGVGTITINSDGSYSFAPAANYVGAIPVITYTVNDNAAVNPLTDTSTLTLTMGANNPPVDGNETNTVTEDTTLTVADGAAGDLLNNATDADSNPLSITSFTVNSTTVPVTPTTPGSTLIPGVGTITINSNGSYSFAPVANYTGAIPVITYTVSDGVGGTDTSTLTLSITAVNDAPVAASGSITPTEDTPISVPLSGTDIDGTIASFTITAGPTPAQGSLVYDNDGNPATPPIAVPLNTPLTPAQAATVQFVPAANYNGTVAPVTYTVTDNQGLASTPATVTINNVTPVNDAPVDGNEANTVAQNVTLNVPAGTGLLANTTDIDGATPTVTSFTVNSTTVPVTPTTPGSTLIPGVGTITINSDGSYSFAPAANYVGAIPVITYTVNDNAAVNPLTDTSTLTLTMGANNPPVDGNETNTVTEDTTLTVADGAAGDLLNNATDADSNPLSITSFTVNSTTVPVTPTTPGSTLIPGVGTITINSNGSYSFAPVANYTGAIPVITYTVSDGVGGTDTSTLTLSITAVNDAPVAASGSITPTEDTPISVPLSGTDIDGTIASFTITAGPTPAQGSLVYDNDGNPATPPIAVPLNTPLTPAQAATVQFVPAANYNGTVAPVTYTVTDNQGLASTPATVTINNVTPVNDAPVDGNEANTVAQNVTLNVPAGTGLLANTTDIDGATPTVTSFTVNSTTVPVTPTTQAAP